MHGTVHTYTRKGCRCVPCKAGWAAYHRDYRRKRVAQGWCEKCASEAVAGQTRCERHRAAQTVAGRAA